MNYWRPTAVLAYTFHGGIRQGTNQPNKCTIQLQQIEKQISSTAKDKVWGIGAGLSHPDTSTCLASIQHSIVCNQTRCFEPLHYRLKIQPVPISPTDKTSKPDKQQCLRPNPSAATQESKAGDAHLGRSVAVLSRDFACFPAHFPPFPRAPYSSYRSFPVVLFQQHLKAPPSLIPCSRQAHRPSRHPVRWTLQPLSLIHI